MNTELKQNLESVTNELAQVDRLNLKIRELQSTRDQIIDRLNSKYGMAEINKLYMSTFS